MYLLEQCNISIFNLIFLQHFIGASNTKHMITGNGNIQEYFGGLTRDILAKSLYIIICHYTYVKSMKNILKN